MCIEDLKNKAFSIFKKRIKYSKTELNELKSIWDSLERNVFPHTNGPYPVSHSAIHITKVIEYIDMLLSATIFKRFVHNDDYLKEKLHILFASGLIHDINMKYCTINGKETIDLCRQQHADFKKIKKTFSEAHNANYNNNLDLICLLASCHANSINEEGKESTTQEKINVLKEKYISEYPFIEYFARILQFADLLDIGPHRLINFDIKDFSKEQQKHYLKHQFFKIITTDKNIVLKQDNDYEDEFNLSSELSVYLTNQFNYLNNYFYYGWNLVCPKTKVRPNKKERYIPTERRIRIQTSNSCNLECKDCHFDEYNRDSIPDSENVLTIIQKLKDEQENKEIFPKPIVEFTLTGGEPFTNRRYINKFITSTNISGDKFNTTYILTNAIYLDNTQIEFLKQNNVNKFRISLNFNSKGEIEQYETRVKNINKLCESINHSQIRINHVIASKSIHDSVLEVKYFIKKIRDGFKLFVPEQINEIGFIQNSKNGIDIHEIANIFCEMTELENDPDNQRISYTIINDLKISFIKLNCDDKKDIIKRCFYCVQEQDIKISSNGKIQTCTGWDQSFKPKYSYIQINTESPLTGISKVIKRKYGIAGFYGHFPYFIKLLKGEKIENIQLSFDSDVLINTLNKIGIILPKYSIEEALLFITQELFNKDSTIKILFNEDFESKDDFTKCTELTISIIKSIYNTSSGGDWHSKKVILNKMLLLLSYITIDESFFSTGRTIIIQGIAEKILLKVSNREYVDESVFIVDSTYCIATIALENTSPEIILEYINLILTDTQKKESGRIQYIVGCIHRQLNHKNIALEAFDNSFKLSNDKITHNNDNFIPLLKEIRAESKRSISSIIKRYPSKKEETEVQFLASLFYSSIDNTKLRYTSLFSNGYSYLLKYFDQEYLENEPNPIYGYQAYILLNDSISLNPYFYASQIRISLLDLAFGNIQLAMSHIDNAKKIFLNKGLLTDQEYLNKVLCDYLLFYIDYEDKSSSIEKKDFSMLVGNNIPSCSNVGYRDIECVMEDMSILEKIILKRKFGEEWCREEFINHIAQFNKQCYELLPDDYFNKKEEYHIKLKSFHHVCIQTNNYKASLEFYTKIIGCEIICENKNFHKRDFNTWLSAGNTRIELQTPKSGEEFIDWSKSNSGPVHICLVVDDVEKAYLKVKENGHKCFKIKNGQELYKVEEKNFKIFKIIAPEGTEVEIRDNPNID